MLRGTALSAKDFVSNGDIDGLDGAKGQANGEAGILLKINTLPFRTGRRRRNPDATGAAQAPFEEQIAAWQRRPMQETKRLGARLRAMEVNAAKEKPECDIAHRACWLLV
jgi:hypothetical protein